MPPSDCSSRRALRQRCADEIAARAGVCKETLYLYFDSKEDLIKELIAQRFSSRITIPLREASEARPSPDTLGEVVATWRSTRWCCP